MLLVLTSVLGYDLKMAVGTSVFIMTFTALTGVVSHFVISGKPNIVIMILFTFIWIRIVSRLANKIEAKKLNIIVGILLIVLGVFYDFCIEFL